MTEPFPQPSPQPSGAVAPKAGTREAQVVLGVFLAFTVGLLCREAMRPQATARPTDVVAKHTVDLNRSGRDELELLPGVGPALAERIVAERTTRGPFRTVEELHRVPGIGDKTVDRLRPLLTVTAPGTLDAPPTVETLERKPAAAPVPGKTGKIQAGEPLIDVNAAEAAELQRLPGVGPATAAKIVEARKLQRFATVDDLRRVKGIGPKTLESVRRFVCVK